MPYRGKPSTGCATCRQRRVKCDETANSCQNCARLGRKCPGYRNLLDLYFQDESDDVRRKAAGQSTSTSTRRTQSLAERPSKRSRTQGRDFQLVLKQNRASTTSPDRITVLFPTVEDRALSFFIRNYIVMPDKGWTSASHPLVQSLMKTVGLAGLAIITHSPEMLKEAEKRYYSAITNTVSAVNSPTRMREDSTLVAVMLLALYETVAGREPSSLARYFSHSRGAMALLVMRGQGRMPDVEYARLYLLLGGPAMAAAQSQGTLDPEGLRDISAEVVKGSDATVLPFYLHGIGYRLSALRSQYTHGVITDLVQYVDTVLEADREMAFELEKQSAWWDYETIYSNKHPEFVYDGYYHIYQGFFQSQIWNQTRVIRIHHLDIIRNILIEGLSSKPPLFAYESWFAKYEAVTATLIALQAEVFASVPQYLGYTSTTSAGATPQPHSNKSCGQDTILTMPWSSFETELFQPLDPRNLEELTVPMMRSFGGYSIIWRLFTAAQSNATSPAARAWVIGILRYLGNNMGVGQAFPLATALEMIDSDPSLENENIERLMEHICKSKTHSLASTMSMTW